MVTDPVCHMEIDEDSASSTTEYKGATYYFCSKGCAAKFEKDPQAYLND